MDLISFGLQEFPLFSHLPRFGTAVYKGELAPKIRRFEVEQGEDKGSVITCAVVVKDEALLGRSFADLVSHIAQISASQLQGFFEWNLLAFDLAGGKAGFSAEDLVSLLVNKARKLETLEETVVRYGNFFSILKKRMKESWGKLEVVISLETFNKLPSQLDLLVKKLIGTTEGIAQPSWIVIHDLSSTPLFRFGEEEQTERMRSTLEKLRLAVQNKLPEIYMVHDNNAVELLTQFGLRSE